MNVDHKSKGCLYVCVCEPHARSGCLWRPEEGIRSFGVGVMSTCGSADGEAVVGWELNQGLLKKPRVFLTVGPFLQPMLLAHFLKLGTYIQK